MIDNQVAISASMMCVNWLNVGADLKILEENGIDYLHWDIVDGSFAPDFTMGSSIINNLLEQTTIKRSDFHLMVEEPRRLFEAFSAQPGDIFTIHQECSKNLHRDIVKIKSLGLRAGVALCPGTPIETLEYVLEDLDVVVLMTVNPGFKGQKLVPQTLRKIEKLRILIDDLKLSTQIEVDGNVNQNTVIDMVYAGADILVGGSSGLFRKDVGLASGIHRLIDSIREGLHKRGARHGIQTGP